MSQLLCRFLGHKASDFTDSGYEICERCGSHGYWDFDEWVLAWQWPPLRWWIQARSWWRLYQTERKLQRYFYDDDCPF